MKNLWYTVATTTPLQDRHIIILIKVDEKEKLNFFKGFMLAPRLDAWNLSQTPMVKNIDKVTGEANEVFQSMAFVYLNYKKNLKMKKSCKIWVWHVLGCGLAIFWLNHGFLTI